MPKTQKKKPILILQFRPETEVSDSEFQAFLKYGGLQPNEVKRIRAEFKMPEINLDDYSAVITGGGPYNVSEHKKKPVQEEVEKNLFSLLQKIAEKDFPHLGNCYGFSAGVVACGGVVSKKKYSEDAGAVTINLTEEGKKDKLLRGIKSNFRAFVGHKEACQQLPPGAVNLAYSSTCPFHMFRLGKNVYAAQFHPELDYSGIAVRIEFYKHHGYFPPEEADALKEKLAKENVSEPMKILKNFVDIYYRQKEK